jgi:hypothetical protein
MKILEVPVYNEDGSIKFTQQVSPEEAQHLLQFAINFLTAAGMAGAINLASKKDPQMELPLTVQ